MASAAILAAAMSQLARALSNLDALAWIQILCALCLSAALSWAGSAKLGSRAWMPSVVAGDPILRTALQPLPAVEILTALAVVVAPTFGSSVVIFLLLTFLGTRPLTSSDCGCFGSMTSLDRHPLIRNVVLLAIAVTLLVLSVATPIPMPVEATVVPVAVGVAGWFGRRLDRAVPTP